MFMWGETNLAVEIQSLPHPSLQLGHGCDRLLATMTCYSGRTLHFEVMKIMKLSMNRRDPQVYSMVLSLQICRAPVVLIS